MVEEENKSLDWKNIEKKELEKNIEVAAGEKKELVKTWPEHVLLFILSLMLAGLIWYTFKSKKTVKVSSK
jgi:hypothetical protein